MHISDFDSMKLYMASASASTEQIKSLSQTDRKILLTAIQNIKTGNLTSQDSTVDIKSVLAKLEKGQTTHIKGETKSSSLFEKLLKGIANVVGELSEGKYGRISNLNLMSNIASVSITGKIGKLETDIAKKEARLQELNTKIQSSDTREIMTILKNLKKDGDYQVAQYLLSDKKLPAFLVGKRDGEAFMADLMPVDEGNANKDQIKKKAGDILEKFKEAFKEESALIAERDNLNNEIPKLKNDVANLKNLLVIQEQIENDKNLPELTGTVAKTPANQDTDIELTTFSSSVKPETSSTGSATIAALPNDASTSTVSNIKPPSVEENRVEIKKLSLQVLDLASQASHAQLKTLKGPERELLGNVLKSLKDLPADLDKEALSGLIKNLEEALKSKPKEQARAVAAEAIRARGKAIVLDAGARASAVFTDFKHAAGLSTTAILRNEIKETKAFIRTTAEASALGIKREDYIQIKSMVSQILDNGKKIKSNIQESERLLLANPLDPKIELLKKEIVDLGKANEELNKKIDSKCPDLKKAAIDAIAAKLLIAEVDKDVRSCQAPDFIAASVTKVSDMIGKPLTKDDVGDIAKSLLLEGYASKAKAGLTNEKALKLVMDRKLVVDPNLKDLIGKPLTPDDARKLAIVIKNRMINMGANVKEINIRTEFNSTCKALDYAILTGKPTYVFEQMLGLNAKDGTKISREDALKKQLAEAQESTVTLCTDVDNKLGKIYPPSIDSVADLHLTATDVIGLAKTEPSPLDVATVELEKASMRLNKAGIEAFNARMDVIQNGKDNVDEMQKNAKNQRKYFMDDYKNAVKAYQYASAKVAELSLEKSRKSNAEYTAVLPTKGVEGTIATKIEAMNVQLNKTINEKYKDLFPNEPGPTAPPPLPRKLSGLEQMVIQEYFKRDAGPKT